MKGLYSCNASWVISNIVVNKAWLFFCDCQLYFEGIWNNYVDIQQKNMQARFTSFYHVRGCNTLSIPIMHYEVWSTNVSKYELVKPISWFFLFRIWFFFFDDIHLQIIASISPKAFVENSSASGLFFFNDNSIDT